MTRTVIQIRCHDEAEKARYEQNAKEAGMSLSAWIREQLNPPVGVVFGTPSPLPLAPAISPPSITRKKMVCPRAHFHRPGVYCRECSRVVTKRGE